MIEIDITGCNKDYLCVDVCPYGFMFEKDDEGYPFVDKAKSEKYCIDCWQCIAICPKGVVSSPGLKPEDLKKTGSKDIPSFDSIIDFIHARRSYRKFKIESVPEDLIEKWLDIARWSPTASNSQKVNYIVVKKRETVSEITEIMMKWLKEEGNYPEIIDAWEKGSDILLRDAPHLLITTLPKDYFWNMTDAATALSYLELSGKSLGLGTCWAGFFTRAAQSYKPLIEKLNLPENHIVAGALMFGYPVYKFGKVPDRKQISLQYI